jgi:UPF0271 protein
MQAIDLNCDMGEGCGNDEQLLDHVSSANIACGFHAGDESTMRAVAGAAIANSVAVGAHPSFPDRENFGRSEMDLPAAEVFRIVVEQVEKMRSICFMLGGRLNHVKPHGALYNMAARDRGLARTIAEAVQKVDETLLLYGLSGSHLISEAASVGLATASEVFADRTYTSEGRLTPRSRSDALVESSDAAIAQVMQMINNGTVTATSGEAVPIVADTICVHGDGEHAVEFARTISSALSSAGVAVRPIMR